MPRPRTPTARNRAGRLRLAALLSLLAISVIGCSRLGSTNGAPAQEAPLRGKQLYDQYCAMCHDATEDLHLIKDPPKLDGLFRKQTLPSGAPATDDQVRKTILDGLGIMPPFEQNLDADDVNELLRYLHAR
jgi:mono/diheme cytochrome c family protein